MKSGMLNAIKIAVNILTEIRKNATNMPKHKIYIETIATETPAIENIAVDK
jgi:hypothetical protein